MASESAVRRVTYVRVNPKVYTSHPKVYIHKAAIFQMSTYLTLETDSVKQPCKSLSSSAIACDYR